MWVQYLGWEDHLEEEPVSHSSILAWKIPLAKKPGRIQSIGLKESDRTKQKRKYVVLVVF